jgi:D-3-phosphoglycerate dehydrogenase / 2-oxoglutarate reductase
MLTHPNIITKPHMGYITKEGFDLPFTDAFEQIKVFAAGSTIHVINPEALT